MFSIESRDTATARVRFASFLKKHITISFSSLNCHICFGPLYTKRKIQIIKPIEKSLFGEIQI